MEITLGTTLTIGLFTRVLVFCGLCATMTIHVILTLLHYVLYKHSEEIKIDKAFRIFKTANILMGVFILNLTIATLLFTLLY